jgi:hypothetical protein
LKRFVYITRVLVVLAPLLALIPVGRMVMDYMEISRVVARALNCRQLREVSTGFCGTTATV